MTSYDDIIDLALTSIEDYRINKLIHYISSANYDFVKLATDYANYVLLCENDDEVAISEKEYKRILSDDYDYEEYVDNSLSGVKMIMDGFMIRGLANFTNCKVDLGQRDSDTRVFNAVLTDLEKSIIADWTVLSWLNKEINDVRQITGMMQNKTEANRYSEANLLKEKTNHKMQLQEDVNKKQTEYGFLNNPWEEWLGGKYGL